MKRTLDLNYNEIVIGSDLSALIYSYKNNCPIIYLRKNIPYEFQKINDELAIEKWRQIMFYISLHNLSPFHNILQSIRFEDSNNLVLTTKDNFRCNINFNNCLISDDYKISGLEYTDKIDPKKYLIVDRFKLSQFLPLKERELIIDKSYFKNIIFYNHVDNKPRNICCTIELSEENMNNPDYSEVVSTIILKRYIKENYNRGNLKPINRDIYSLEKTKYFGLPENIKVLDETPENLLLCENKTDKYINYLESLIYER